MLWFVPTVVTLLFPATVAAAEPGNGFGSARLVDGTPDFSDCIEGGGTCQDDFYAFLSESMLSQGLTMQDHALGTSTLTHRRTGWTVGGSLGVFPLGPPPENLSGKEENTQFSPVFPRLTAGWMTGESAKGQAGVGLSFTPPVPVQGASALGLGLNGALTRGSATDVRLGLEGDLSFIRANAPIAATEDQVADRDNFSNPDNLDPEQFDEVCGEDVDAGAGGCIDTYTQLNFSVRAGQSWHTASGFTPYLKVGATLVNEWLYIKYDDTTWGLTAVQPTVHAGSGWNIGEHVFLAAGATAALRQANQSESGSMGLFYTFEGAAAWAF